MSLNEPFVVIRLVVIVIVRVIDLFFIFYSNHYYSIVLITQNTRDTQFYESIPLFSFYILKLVMLFLIKYNSNDSNNRNYP